MSDSNNDNLTLTGFPESLDNNLCYECRINKKEDQDGYWEKFVEYQGKPTSVFICDSCFENPKPNIICPKCKWVGADERSIAIKDSETTAESGYCPKCYPEIVKCLRFDD